MKNLYLEFKNKHEKEINNFPMSFAFTDEQFRTGMEKLGLKETDTDKVYSIGGGGFIRKSDSKAFGQMFEKHEKEFQEKIKADTTGEGFIFDMFKYELANHEYSYTMEVDETLNALNLTIDDINNNKNLLYGLTKAKKECQEWDY